MFPTGDGFYYVFVSECDEPLSDSCYIVRTLRNELTRIGILDTIIELSVYGFPYISDYCDIKYLFSRLYPNMRLRNEYIQCLLKEGEVTLKIHESALDR